MGDAYAALLVSVALIVVVAMISTMLYDIGNGFVFMLNATMFVMSFFGVYIIYKSAPFEIKTYKNHKGPKERQRATFLLLALLPIGVLAALYLAVTSGLGMGLLALGLFLMPPGIYAFMDDAKVTQLDNQLDKFIRSLGNVAEALGSTLSVAMSKIDRRSLGPLEPYVKRLQIRLRNQISPKVCWDRFKDETGSELVNRSTTMFLDGTNLGGSPSRVGEIAADYALTMSLLRAKRFVTATPFAYLTIPLHGAMTALLIFVMEIMRAFNGKLTEAVAELDAQRPGASLSMPNLPVFQPSDITETTVLTMGAVIVLTIANTLAPKFATGGHHLKLAFYGSIMCTLSGLNLILIPPVASSLIV